MIALTGHPKVERSVAMEREQFIRNLVFSLLVDNLTVEIQTYRTRISISLLGSALEELSELEIVEDPLDPIDPQMGYWDGGWEIED